MILRINFHVRWTCALMSLIPQSHIRGWYKDMLLCVWGWCRARGRLQLWLQLRKVTEQLFFWGFFTWWFNSFMITASELSTRSGLWDSITEREIELCELWTYIIKPVFVPKPNVTGGRFSVYYNQLWMRPPPVLIVELKKAVELRNFRVSSKLK